MSISKTEKKWDLLLMRILIRRIINIGCHIIRHLKHQVVNICSEWQLVRVYGGECFVLRSSAYLIESNTEGGILL